MQSAKCKMQKEGDKNQVKETVKMTKDFVWIPDRVRNDEN